MGLMIEGSSGALGKDIARRQKEGSTSGQAMDRGVKHEFSGTGRMVIGGKLSSINLHHSII